VLWTLIQRYIPLHVVALLAVLGAGLYVQSSDYAYRQQIQNFLFDNLNKTYPRKASDQVVILDIDEKSLDRPELGQWPWPRPIVADLISKLKEYEVKVMGFDMVFAEADNTSPEQIVKSWKSRGTNSALFDEMKGLESHDKIMSRAVRSAGNVVLGLNFEDRREKGAFGYTPRPKAQIGIEHQGRLERYVYPYDTVANYPILSRFAYGEGHFYATPDTDGIYRTVPVIMGVQKKNIRVDAAKIDHYFFYPSLASELLRYVVGGHNVYLGGEGNRQYYIEGAGGKYGIPVNEDGDFYVWYADPNPAWYISAYDVLNGKIDAARLKDKIVLVGTSAIGLKDIRSTPLSPHRPGVEVHLNIVDQALQGQYLKRPQSLVYAEQGALIILALLVIITFLRSALIGQTIIMLGGVALLFAASNIGYVQYGLLIDGAYPAIVLFLVYVTAVALSYILSERERKEVRHAFEHYISPSYMKQLTQNPDKLKLGGEEKIITTMFSDIRNFTTICESLTPDEIISLMNDFLTPLSTSIMEHRGTIDKYMGDAIMAFWNAPIDDAYHTVNACKAALQMIEQLDVLNAQRREHDRDTPLLAAGIGINTGLAAVGNMGSDQRFAYSALGDSVNLASRLEAQTKAYRVDIILGQGSVAENGVDALALLELDLLRVKGRSAPTRIYTLLGDEKMAKSEGFIALQAAHNKLLSLYRGQKWAAARKEMQNCASLSEKLDVKIRGFYTVLDARVDALQNADIPQDWDGVYEARSK
jgi:adenylate cyclase